jgi:hypothetical protein
MVAVTHRHIHILPIKSATDIEIMAFIGFYMLRRGSAAPATQQFRVYPASRKVAGTRTNEVNDFYQFT